jgi:hypothetical protein
MTSRQPPRVALGLLEHLVADNEPLIGDLIEGCAERSHAWFWRQVLFVVIARTIAHAWTNFRQRATLEGALVSIAMLVVLSFQVVVAGGVLNYLLGRLDVAWVTRISDHPDWLTYLIVLSFMVASVIGRVTGCFHHRFRVAAVLVCGASATLAALVTLTLLNPTPMRPFLPSATLQTAAAIAFIFGLFVGVPRTERCAFV